MDGLFIAFSNSLVALAICMAVGYICRKTNMISDTHTVGMTNLLVRITMPATMFLSLYRSEFSRALLLECLATVIITGVFFVLGGYLGLLIAKIMKASPEERQNWQFGVAFGNIGFMGIPIITVVFGYEGLIYVAMALTAFNILTFTIGMRMFDNAPRDFSFKNIILRNPAISAVIVGFTFFVTGWALPDAIEGGITLIGGITSPMSMILLGVILARQSLKSAFTDVRLLPPIAVKLLLIPLVAFFALRWIIPNPLMFSVIITLMAMPPAALTAIFAEQFNANAFTSAKFVVVGTILCIITVPVIALLF
ncbi:MAG: AEC family transporter [Firmicutes bacterium]|nr:AEC family transporter [Bacillota bacterium]